MVPVKPRQRMRSVAGAVVAVVQRQRRPAVQRQHRNFRCAQRIETKAHEKQPIGEAVTYPCGPLMHHGAAAQADIAGSHHAASTGTWPGRNTSPRAITAHAIRQVCRKNAATDALAGIYHLVASGETTWHGYASHVVAQARGIKPELDLKVKEIVAVPTSAFVTPAQRPLNSRLSTRKLQQTFGLVLPPWQQGVDRLLTEIL